MHVNPAVKLAGIGCKILLGQARYVTLLASVKTEAGLDIRREDGMLQAIMFKSRSRMELEDGRRRTVKLEAFRGLLLGI